MSSELHRIRLRRPWQCQVLGDRTRWTRRFGRPTGLSPEERIWLVFEGFPTGSSGSLNGQPLGQGEGGQLGPYEVTHRLELRNELVLETPLVAESPRTPADDPPGLVFLEIRYIGPGD